MEQIEPNAQPQPLPQACGCPGQIPKYICENESCPRHFSQRYFCSKCQENGYHDHAPYPRPQIGQNSEKAVTDWEKLYEEIL